MELTVTTNESATVAAISVDVDARTAPELQRQILPLLGAGRALILDMSGVAYMSSAGLRMLLSVYRQAAGSGARLLLSGLSQELRDVMSATGFLDQFTTADSVEAAQMLLRAG